MGSRGRRIERQTDRQTDREKEISRLMELEMECLTEMEMTLVRNDHWRD